MALTYSRSTLRAISSLFPSKPLCPILWRSLTSLGISRFKPTHRGTRAGQRKRRPTSSFLETNSPDITSKQQFCNGFSITYTNRELEEAHFHNSSSGPLNMQADTSVQVNSTVPSTELSRKNTYFVPSLLLSNTMSLAPKIDEISYFISSNDIDVSFFTETWLKEIVPDDTINITNYKLLRRDRKHKAHGGVCLYVKKTISYRLLPDLQSEDHEVFWSLLRPKRLPRGFSNIVVRSPLPPRYQTAWLVERSETALW